MTADSRKIVPLDAGNYPAMRLKYFLSTGKEIVQRFLKMRRRLRKFTPNLQNILLVALLNLILEELLQCAVPQTVLPLLREIRDQIRHQRARESLRLCVRIVR